MAGRPIARARDLLSNPGALRSLRLDDIFRLCALCSGVARKNPVDPDEPITAQLYITRQKRTLDAKAKKYAKREWEDALHLAVISLLSRTRLIPGTAERAPLLLPVSAWDDIAEKELQQESLQEQRRRSSELRKTESLSPDPESDAAGLRQARAEAKVAIAEAEGEIDTHSTLRKTSKEVKHAQMRQLLSYLPRLEPQKQFLLITLHSGSLKSFLRGDIAQASYLLRQVDAKRAKDVSEVERDRLEELSGTALRHKAEAESLLALVLSVDALRPKGLPPGDVAGGGDTPLARRGASLARLDAFIPGAREAIEEAYAEIRVAQSNPRAPTWRRAVRWRRESRSA